MHVHIYRYKYIHITYIYIWRLLFILNSECLENYLLPRKSSASLPRLFRDAGNFSKHANSWHSWIDSWMIRESTSAKDAIMGLGSAEKVLVVNLFRIYFRGPSADYSSTSKIWPSKKRRWTETGNIIFLKVNLQMNSVMNLFRASLPQVFRKSSAPLPRCGEMLQLWRCGIIFIWLALWLPLRG